MTKNTYPITTLKPLQRLDFQLSNGMSVRTILMPQPNSAGTRVAHVELDYAVAGSEVFTPVGHEGQARSVIEAAALAYEIARSQGQNAGGVDIVKVLLEGEEFLERADMERLTANTIPVKVV